MSRSQVLQSTDSLNPFAEATADAAEAPSIVTPTVAERTGMHPEDLQMAHELCTPLTALRSAIEILCESDLTEENERMARIAQRNVERMTLIIEAMLSKRTTRS